MQTLINMVYSGYGTGFDGRSSFAFLGGGFGLNIIIWSRYEFFCSYW